jgi:uncharacterized protein
VLLLPVKPAPRPDEVSLPYWQAALGGVLAVQRCAACGNAQFPPDLICHRCACDRLHFEATDGVGMVYSFAIYTRSFDEAFPVPYVLALVDLVQWPSVRLMVNIVDTPHDMMHIGMPVEVTFEQRGEWRLPQFRAKAAAG